MKNKILAAIQAISALCLMGAVKIWAPVCGKLLELANGNQVPMKCHWAGQAAIALAVVALAAALTALLSQKSASGLLLVNAVTGVVIFLVFTSLIGVCAGEEMRCQTTRLWGMGTAAVITLTSLIGLLTNKEGQIPT